MCARRTSDVMAIGNSWKNFIIGGGVCSRVPYKENLYCLILILSDVVKVSDYHFGGRGFNPRLELSIFTLMASRLKKNCECGYGSEPLNGF
ncbi:hypothetical protein DPMN_111783 [Dreissena polymorpha]|uniref:Uncharacterized protein n=1 Tax=Dreissena polymorpha TaxID=45954 RepID=A0A9D4KF73_DREPO|nr:hypothetical protein DPMN_111783 [Dreissena polymorpha]